MSCVFPSHLCRGLELASAAVFIHKCGEEWTLSGPTKRVRRPERVGKPFIGRALAFGIISGFYVRALRGVLGAFSSLQVAQD